MLFPGVRVTAFTAVLCCQACVIASDIPSAQERQELHAVMQRHRKATFLVEAGGTAFAICRTYRLLATAGHVAENIRGRSAHVVMSETGRRYRVGRVWVHPDLTSWKGVKSPSSVDVGIIQLTGDGPPLPVEWKIRMQGNPESVEQYAVGLSGFSGMGYRDPLRLGEAPMPLFVCGIVQTVSGTIVRGDNIGPRWTIRSTAPAWGGASGSPLFTRTGAVVGIHTGGSGVMKVYEDNARIGFISVSSDSIWDLVRRSKGSPYPIPDLYAQETYNIHLRSIPNDGLARLESERAVSVPVRARGLVEEARNLRDRRAYASAIETLTEATRIAPRWAVPYDERSRTRAANVGRNRLRMHHSAIWREVELAAQESFRALELDPTNLRYHDMYGRTLCAITTERGNRAWARSVKRFCEVLLRQDSLTGINKARVHSLHSYVLRVLGEHRGALAEIDRAIALKPSEPDYYRSKYWVLRAMGRHNEAQRFLQRAELLER